MKSRIVFLGTGGSSSIYVLKNLYKRYDVEGVVESSNDDIGSFSLRIIKKIYKKMTSNNIYNFSYVNKLPYIQLCKNESQEKLNIFLEKIKPDIVCICSFSFLLKDIVLDRKNCVFINAHPSFLPNYRGPNPLFWNYYNMEKYTGVTIHLVDRGEDNGDIIHQKKIKIPMGIDKKSLNKIISDYSFKLLSKSIDNIQKNQLSTLSQNHNSSKFRAPRVKKSEKFIDWESWPSDRAYHFLRGTRKQNEINQGFSKYLYNFEVISYKKLENSPRTILGNLYKYKNHYLVFCSDGFLLLKKRKIFHV